MTVFLSTLNQMELHLVQNQKENCHNDHIPFKYDKKTHFFLIQKLKYDYNLVLGIHMFQFKNIVYSHRNQNYNTRDSSSG